MTEMDKAVLAGNAWPGIRNCALVGVGGFILALVGAAFTVNGWERLGFAYLIGFSFVLAITLGCLFFVLITTLFRAGWCVTIRRLPETMAANMPTLAALFLPILIVTWAGTGAIYPWSNPAIHDVYGNKDGKSHATVDLNNPFILAAASPEEMNASIADEKAGPELEITAESHGHAAGAQEMAPGFDEHAGDAAHGEEHVAGHEGVHAWTHTAEVWPAHAHAVPYFVYKKGQWLTRWAYTLRWVIYFALWTAIGVFFWRQSTRQDADKDVMHTHRREWWAPLSIIAFASTITLASFDLLMSIDPVWYSTMFGVYYFAGAVIAAISFMIVVLMLGQRAGYFPSVTTDHFHDLGKLLFAFVFFWGYVGFSQFMLIWYASLPETTYWWEIRGVTSVAVGPLGLDGAPTYGSGWTVVAWTLLFAHLLLPFAILLSKHVKRNRTALFTMACWMLTLCYIDLYWVTMPAFSSPALVFGLPEIGCVIGCVGIMLAGALRLAAKHSLLAHGDPRLHEALGLDTTAWAPIHATSH